MEDLRILNEQCHLGIKVDQMKQQSQGIYASQGVAAKFDADDFVFNWISPKLEIRQTKYKGRGVFLKQAVKKGELLFVEKPIECVYQYQHVSQKKSNIRELVYLIRQCSEIANLKGQHALRLSYLHYDPEIANMPIPPIEIFTQNEYKQYGEIPELS